MHFFVRAASPPTAGPASRHRREPSWCGLCWQCVAGMALVGLEEWAGGLSAYCLLRLRATCGVGSMWGCTCSLRATVAFAVESLFWVRRAMGVVGGWAGRRA